MKVTTNPNSKKSFQSFDLVIHVESDLELRILFTVANAADYKIENLIRMVDKGILLNPEEVKLHDFNPLFDALKEKMEEFGLLK